MPFITLGTSAQLQIKVPTRGSTGWDETLRTDTFLKIAQHDHTGSGNGTQLTENAFADDAISGAKIRLDNDEYLTARNAANSADINIVKVDSNDEIYFGADISNAQFEDDGFTIVDNADNTKKVAFQVSGVTTGTTRTLTIPDADDTIVGLAATQTLTNKTLTTPVIASISNSGTITVPTGTDTLVARATTDTLTNKSIDSDNNTITNIVNADIKAAAAIALDKLAATTASRALVSDVSGFVSASAVTSTELGYVSGVTSAIQTQIDGKMTDPMTTTGDIIYESSGPQRLAIGTAGQVLQVSGGVPAWGTNTVAPVAPTSKTTTYTALTTDDCILADTSGGAWTLTLYAASGNGGRRLKVIKTTSDTDALTIDGNASETINGNTTTTLVTQYETIVLYCDGTNWLVEDRACNTAWASYTPTGSWTSNATYTGYWRRNGDSMDLDLKVALSGAPNAANLSINLPSGVTIDTGKQTHSNNYKIYGTGIVNDATSTDLYCWAAYNSTTSIVVMTGDDAAGGIAIGNVNAGNPFTFAASDFITIKLEGIPITEWKAENE
jgi:hypothetical protein